MAERRGEEVQRPGSNWVRHRNSDETTEKHDGKTRALDTRSVLYSSAGKETLIDHLILVLQDMSKSIDESRPVMDDVVNTSKELRVDNDVNPDVAMCLQNAAVTCKARWDALDQKVSARENE